jgi:fructan beta-fructosidase
MIKSDRRISVAALILCLLSNLLSSPQHATANDYNEPWRPQLHFTPDRNFMNDPNGLVYYKGEYHLFYQHNPFGKEWGHMSWGHAVSPNLLHWQHLPVALLEENGIMMFSGSAVVDWKNSSGFGSTKEPPLVAIYTGHTSTNQHQSIAFSNDRGRTWTKYIGNPVLDIGQKDFRDPKVIWHEPSKQWIMVVALPVERKVRFYASPNLKEWKLKGEFGPAGAPKGIWECPDLFPLRVEGKRNLEKWVLIVSVNPGGPNGGSASQYFVGSFDGAIFVNESSPETVRWLDHGKDFYAAVTWSDIPKADGRCILLGWMSNWEYANQVPTATWRNAQSLPRELSLREVDGNIVLLQKPVEELKSLRKLRVKFPKQELFQKHELVVPNLRGDCFELRVKFSKIKSSELGVVVRVGENEATPIAYRPASGELFVDRTRSGKGDFGRTFPGIHKAIIGTNKTELSLHIIVDRSSIEVFADDGAHVITETIFPGPESVGTAFYSADGSAVLEEVEFWNLNSIYSSAPPKPAKRVK